MLQPVSTALKSAMDARCLSAKDLARQAGIAQSTITRILRGAPCQPRTLHRLVKTIRQVEPVASEFVDADR